MSDGSLPTFRFPAGTHIVQVQPPQHGPVTLDSPAMAVFTDLAQIRAATVQPQTSLDQAELKMIYQGVRLLFVVSDMPSVDGILTAADIAGDKPMRLVHQRQVKHQDLTAADVMTPLADIDAITFAALQRATVAEVVATLTQRGRPHLLVIDSDTADRAPRIRGLVSQTQVERQLGQQLPLTAMAQTFSELEQVLAGH
ncbi:CBS-domain-containing membrane protein [Rhodoferax ferrireducens]|uniref:CBS-domain-containing membrane protein n=1 Tax=Rhodoferax ferrireducens TaxID=192843 RepID=A0ABU2CE74_9BURK|nr:CBS domain-containing protein [Rhodoferax ferrireducens]MDR7379635.1 CBS-domain-containing membrane protein [Rhodoferax ferrireducens]